MVFLGGTPAALIGVISIIAGWLRFREKWNDFFFNLLTYITFPVVVGTAFHEIVDRSTGSPPRTPSTTSWSSACSSSRWRSTSR